MFLQYHKHDAFRVRKASEFARNKMLIFAYDNGAVSDALG